MLINTIPASPTGEFVYRSIFIWGGKKEREREGKGKRNLKRGKKREKEERRKRAEGTKEEIGEKNWERHKKIF